jgi:hypothetical protein
MQYLAQNWFLEPVLDFEYKSYEVLGYTQKLEKVFDQWRFFPYFDEFATHIQQIKSYRKAKAVLEEKLKRDIEKIDLQQMKLVKAGISGTSTEMAQLEEILRFAAGKFEEMERLGREQLNLARNELEISPLGLIDLNNSNGLLLFRKLDSTRIYEYAFRAIRRPGNKYSYKDLRTNYLTEINTGRFANYSDIKWKAIKNAGATTGTNAYLISTNVEIPYFATLMPCVKNYLIAQAG